MSDASDSPETAALSVRDVVRKLGGYQRVADLFGVGYTAVCNWCAADAVPARHELRMWRLAQEAGLPWRPPGSDGLALPPAPTDTTRDAA
jgi:hypothetical protein